MQELALYKKEAQEVLCYAEDLNVTDQESYEICIAYRKACKGVIQRIEAHYKPKKQAALVPHKLLVEEEKKYITIPKKADGILKRKQEVYFAQQETERRKEEAKLREAAKEQGLDETLVEIPVEKPAGVTYRDKWVWKVSCFSDIPREYLVPNEQQINKIVQVDKDKTTIPGIEVRCHKIAVLR